MNNDWLRDVFDSIAIRGREILGLENNAANKQDLHTLCRQLLMGQGEASGIALSQEILHIYNTIITDEKKVFFQMLAQEYNPRLDQLQIAMEKYQRSHSAQDLVDLTAAVEAPRQELFRRMNMAPDGTASLVGLRADLLDLLKDNPELIAVDADLKHILTSWFNRGFLQLQDIDWRSPAHILEKLINYESVHEIQGWDDLRRRLMKDRRCFAFFHPAMPDEPLIFIEVALVQGITSAITDLIDPDTTELDPKRADTAIFYSINNTQKGLRGISFGHFLIKQVLTELSFECPWIKVTSTLSPVPSFSSALEHWFKGDSQQPHQMLFEVIAREHSTSIKAIAEQYTIDSMQTEKTILKALLLNKEVLKEGAIINILSSLALAYLISRNDDGKLPDAVARFHLSNGAQLERINVNADMSEHGISTSYGIMVNYLYDLSALESNHEAFVTRGKVMMSDSLLKKVKQFSNTH